MATGRTGDEDCVKQELVFCTECSKKRRKTSAVKFCQECTDYLCEVCFDNHDSETNRSGHVIIEISDLEKCPSHPEKIIDMICETHDEVGCETCMKTKHDVKTCRTVNIRMKTNVAAPSASRIRETAETLQFIRNLGNTVTFQNDSTKAIESAYEDLKYHSNQLSSYTEQLQNQMTTLLDTNKSKLDFLHEKITEDLTDQSSDLNKDLTVANDLRQKAEVKLQEGNIFQFTVCSKLAMSKYKNIKHRKEVRPEIEISFQPHVSSEDLFQTFQRLQKTGEFSTVVPYKTDLKYPRYVDFSISDEPDSWIRNMCALLDGTILLVDYNNSCLKRILPRKDEMSDLVQFCFRPIAVCVINQREAAVTLPTRKRIQIVSIETKMSLKGKFDVDFECRGIACHAGKFYIAGDLRFYVYSLAGKLLSQFDPRIPSRISPIPMLNLAISDCGNVLYTAGSRVGGFEASLNAIDINSSYKTRRMANHLSMALDVCVDGHGSVFASGFDHNYRFTVLQLSSKTFESLSWKATKEDDITAAPYSVCFDRSTSRLFVAKYQENDPEHPMFSGHRYWKNNEMMVFHLSPINRITS